MPLQNNHRNALVILSDPVFHISQPESFPAAWSSAAARRVTLEQRLAGRPPDLAFKRSVNAPGEKK
jgi:hypothetical protein